VTVRCPIVFLLDVDNTLLDDDAVQQDVGDRLERDFGLTARDRYSRILQDLSAEFGFRDYLGALQRYRIEHPSETELLSLSSFLIEYPFGERLFPAALDVLKRLRKLAPTVILAEGDVVLQARKLERAGLSETVEGRLLIYTGWEMALDGVERRYPAEHYVLVDDKLRALAAAKKSWGGGVTTVFARQGGHHARASKALGACPPVDVTITRIGDLLGDLPRLWTAPQLIPRIQAREMAALTPAE